jgi:transcriptional regulator with GAF, ATPase, and Fis domain
MQQHAKWILAPVGAFMVLYSFIVLGYVVTSPDVRLRFNLIDAQSLAQDSTVSDGLPDGITIESIQELDTNLENGDVIYLNEPPQSGDRIERINNNPIHTFLDFAIQLRSLRGAEISPSVVNNQSMILNELESRAKGNTPQLLWIVHVNNDTENSRWVEVDYRHGNEKRICYLKIQTVPISEILVSLIWFILEIALSAISALAYWNRPYDRPSRLFFMLSAVSLGAFMGGYNWWIIWGNMWLKVPFTVAAILVPVVLLHFFLVFPRPLEFINKQPLFTNVMLYGAPVVTMGFILLKMGYIYWLPFFVDDKVERIVQSVNAIREISRWTHTYFLISGIFFLTTVLVLWQRHRTTPQGLERKQLKVFWWAALVASLGIVLTIWLSSYNQPQFVLADAKLPMFMVSLCFMAAYAIGIFRYRMMLIDQMVNRGMRYYLATSILTILFGFIIGLSTIVPEFLNISLSSQQKMFSVIVLTLLAVLIIWVRDRFQQLLDQRYYRQKYQLDKAFQRMNRISDQMVESDSLGEMMLGSCRDVLNVERSAFYLRSSTDTPFQRIASDGTENIPEEIIPLNELIDPLKESGSIQKVSQDSRDDISMIQGYLHDYDFDLMHALEVEQGITGLILLGKKKDGTAYTAEDLTFLNALSQFTNVALHSANVDNNIKRLNEEVQLKVDKIADQQRQLSILEAELVHEKQYQDHDEKLLQEKPSDDFDRSSIIGNSFTITQTLETARKVADSDSSVLILGESGTGKELLARLLHDNSSRKSNPLVSVHCASLSPGLLESELFGHVKGAFTGAHQDKVGRFEMASGGTLFLDEIGDISMEIQIKLLRVLQERTLERVGGTKSVPINVRLVTATHQNLDKLIQEGTFREDLYYRLNVVNLVLSPLRERMDDIYELALFFCDKICERLNKKPKRINKEAFAILEGYHWPGNIRELQNVIERAVVLSEGDIITVADLPAEMVESVSQFRSGNWSRERFKQENDLKTRSSFVEPVSNPADFSSLNRPEKEILIEALQNCNGNKAKAARSLGLPRSTYYSKLKKYNIS